MNGPDYIVDIDGLRHLNIADGENDIDSGEAPAGRPWISVHWKCCSTYSRIYRDRSGLHYAGTCPRCSRPVRARIGRDGTNARFFEAT